MGAGTQRQRPGQMPGLFVGRAAQPTSARLEAHRAILAGGQRNGLSYYSRRSSGVADTLTSNEAPTTCLRLSVQGSQHAKYPAQGDGLHRCADERIAADAVERVAEVAPEQCQEDQRREHETKSCWRAEYQA